MAPFDIPSHELYIGGKWVAPESNKRLPVICPFTEGQIGTIPAGGAPEVKAAVSAATAAFYNGSWSKLTGAERASYLRKIAEKVRHVHLPVYCSAQNCLDNSRLCNLSALYVKRCLSSLMRHVLQIRRPLQVKEKKDLLARLETLDNGKPISEAAWDIVRILSRDVLSSILTLIASRSHLGLTSVNRPVLVHAGRCCWVL